MKRSIAKRRIAQSEHSLSKMLNKYSRICFVHFMYPYPHALYSYMYQSESPHHQSVTPNPWADLLSTSVQSVSPPAHSTALFLFARLSPFQNPRHQNTPANLSVCRPVV